MKQIIIYVCIILLTFSLYHDLQKDPVHLTNMPPSDEETEPVFYVKKRALAGDTALSLIETVNGNIINEMSIEQILYEFEKINNLTDYKQLKINNIYHVPIFKYEKRTGINQP